MLMAIKESPSIASKPKMVLDGPPAKEEGYERPHCGNIAPLCFIDCPLLYFVTYSNHLAAQERVGNVPKTTSSRRLA